MAELVGLPASGYWAGQYVQGTRDSLLMFWLCGGLLAMPRRRMAHLHFGIGLRGFRHLVVKPTFVAAGPGISPVGLGLIQQDSPRPGAGRPDPHRLPRAPGLSLRINSPHYPTDMTARVPPSARPVSSHHLYYFRRGPDRDSDTSSWEVFPAIDLEKKHVDDTMSQWPVIRLGLCLILLPTVHISPCLVKQDGSCEFPPIPDEAPPRKLPCANFPERWVGLPGKRRIMKVPSFPTRFSDYGRLFSLSPGCQGPLGLLAGPGFTLCTGRIVPVMHSFGSPAAPSPRDAR